MNIERANDFIAAFRRFQEECRRVGFGVPAVVQTPTERAWRGLARLVAARYPNQGAMKAIEDAGEFWLYGTRFPRP